MNLEPKAPLLNIKLKMPPIALAKSDGENSLSTPDFRFVKYSYQAPTWAGPLLPQMHQASDMPFAPELLDALRRIR
jgi:hypothetical protein